MAHANFSSVGESYHPLVEFVWFASLALAPQGLRTGRYILAFILEDSRQFPAVMCTLNR